MSKLYTEEQVRKIFENLSTSTGYDYYMETYCDSLTPIVLPSDEEIEIMSYKYAVMHEDISDKVGKYIIKVSCLDGAKWIKEQILNQNK